ncbi:hypothetical protein [Sulfurimonas sp.]|uniref:hypothetical protein n=1 Tax=Sulfurimonas sp. TaxID=2022749 RepID=UPI0035695F17
MKKYFKTDSNNLVIQVQPNKEEGFIETEYNVICGMLFENNSFSIPKILLTPEQELEKVKSTGEIYTLNNVDYQVSFMKDDADGLMQVSMAFQLGLTETIIHFENGTKMPIKNTEFEAFAIWFVGKRNSFFVGE